MPEIVQFELFDPDADYSVREGNLPHWFQPGVTYFVTFRTEDSVPVELSRKWYRRRDEWLRRHGIDPRESNWQALLRALPISTQREFSRDFTAEFMSYLDRGYGACELRRPDLANTIATSLRHFDGQRYRLGDFVVMPNHVHLLCCLLGNSEIETSATRGRNSRLAKSTAPWDNQGDSGRKKASTIWCAVPTSSTICEGTSRKIRCVPGSRSASFSTTVPQCSRHSPCAVALF